MQYMELVIGNVFTNCPQNISDQARRRNEEYGTALEIHLQTWFAISRPVGEMFNYKRGMRATEPMHLLA